MPKRTMSLWLTASLLSAGCSTTFDFVPASAADVREGVTATRRDGAGTVRDAKGDVHWIDASSKVRVRDNGEPPGPRLAVGTAVDGRTMQLDVSELLSQCAPGKPCPLDDPRATFEIGKRKYNFLPYTLVTTVLGLAAMGGLIYGNVACLEKSGCSTPVAITVGTIDGFLVLGGVLVLVAAGMWSNFR